MDTTQMTKQTTHTQYIGKRVAKFFEVRVC